MIDRIQELLGDQASLLDYRCTGIAKDQLHLPGSDFIDRVMAQTDRNPQVLRSLQSLYDHGRAAGTGYVSILPVDQGIEHSGAASFAPNPIYFDPENIVKLAIEGGCNAVASTLGVLGSMSRKYAHKIPFMVKINHNEILTYPNFYDQTLFASVEQAWNLGAAGIGATIYFGSENCRRQIMEISDAFQQAHELGMFTVLWCYLRNPAFKHEGTDYHASADLTGQANHLGVTIEADIVKQKQPTNNGGYTALEFRQDPPPGLREAGSGQSHRAHSMAGGQLLYGPHRPHQLGRFFGRQRPRSGGDHRGHQQARRRDGAHLRPQGLPEAHGRRRQAPQRDPGRLHVRDVTIA